MQQPDTRDLVNKEARLALPGTIVEAVYEACGRVRKPVLAELSRDILVMVTSLRPAVLIDYASLPPSALRKVLTLVQAAAAPLHGGLHLEVAVLDGCCLLVNVDILISRLNDPCPVDPRYIAFDVGRQGTSCRWATEAETSAVNFQLTSLQQLLASHCAEGGSQCLDLDLPGLPLKPTLQGWLLGYPVVYLCTEDTVPQISRFLSAEQLVLFTMVAGCPLLQKAIADHTGATQSRYATPAKHVSYSTLQNVCAFSVPAMLLRDDSRENIGRAWQRTVWARTGDRWQVLWKDIQVASNSVSAAIVL